MLQSKQNNDDNIIFVKLSSNVEENNKLALKEGDETRAWRSIFDVYQSFCLNYDNNIKLLVDKEIFNRISSMIKEKEFEIVEVFKNF